MRDTMLAPLTLRVASQLRKVGLVVLRELFSVRSGGLFHRVYERQNHGLWFIYRKRFARVHDYSDPFGVVAVTFCSAAISSSNRLRIRSMNGGNVSVGTKTSSMQNLSGGFPFGPSHIGLGPEPIPLVRH
jgi:hypothetical protein